MTQTSTMRPPPAPAAVQHDIEQFLYFEAQLQDERRYVEWLELMAEDVHYWAPTLTTRTKRERKFEVALPTEVAHFDDNLQHLQMRIDRLGTGQAWSEEPQSRTRHLITNVIVHAQAENGEHKVLSNFLLYRRRGETNPPDVFAGCRVDVLRPGGPAGWLIASRRIELDQTLILAKNLSIFF
ncbi:3-phenylpropionate/cinnamic acid dioxygenase subunit beta [Nocardioides sp. NPDC000441]|uniref:3-phenylpropionate/cinnamic acid dioxygenase subunit beta n=2 Tax=unclassified Nocardioides TaxID=2615069 RepID=UPI003326B0CE